MNYATVEVIKKHVYSFVKSYVVAFLAIAFYANDTGVDVFTMAFLVPAAKSSLLVALRNVYKFITEGDVQKLS